MTTMRSTVMKRALGILLLAAPVLAQRDAGTLAGVQGNVDVRRHGSAWQAATVGQVVQVGDGMRTGASSRAKVVFLDDTVVDLGPTSELIVEKQHVESARAEAVIRLAKGKVRAWVGDRYRQPRSRYEIETPTAVA